MTAEVPSNPRGVLAFGRDDDGSFGYHLAKFDGAWTDSLEVTAWHELPLESDWCLRCGHEECSEPYCRPLTVPR